MGKGRLRVSRKRPFSLVLRNVRRALAAAEQRQDDLRRLVGDRQGLSAELLLDLQRLQLGRFLGEVSVDQVADAVFNFIGQLDRKSVV